MAINKITRRQFVGGAAAVAGAAAISPLTTVSTAAATSTGVVPDTAITSGWTALDATAAARKGYEIYRGKWTGQSG